MGVTDSSQGLLRNGDEVQSRGLVRLTIPPKQGERDMWLRQADQVLSTCVAQLLEGMFESTHAVSAMVFPRQEMDVATAFLL